MNLADEQYHSRVRREAKADREMATHILSARVPPGATEAEIRAHMEEKGYTEAHIDRLMKQVVILQAERNDEMGGKPEMQVHIKALVEWLEAHLRDYPKAKPEDVFAKAQKELDKVPCTFQTFRTGYFYRIRAKVRAELGLPSMKRPRRTQEEIKAAKEEKKKKPFRKTFVKKPEPGVEARGVDEAMEELVEAGLATVVEEKEEVDPREYIPTPGEGPGIEPIPGEGAGLIAEDLLPEKWDATDVIMMIEAPGGRLRFQVKPDGVISLEVSGDDMDTFLVMMEWLEKALPVMTGTEPFPAAMPCLYRGPAEE